MLQLVVDNTKSKKFNLMYKEREPLTCRHNCDLFDEITGTCSIKLNVDLDSPLETARCGHFINKDIFTLTDEEDYDWGYNDLEVDYSIIDDNDLFHEIIGSKLSERNSKYPLQPDFPARRDDATWYISPDESFGCYIVNDYKKPMSLPLSIEVAEKGWANKVYKSPVPLHNHKSSLSLASKMAWYIDKDGYGQYVLLANGKISTISFPRPSNWGK